MLRTFSITSLQERAKKASFWMLASALALSGLLPVVLVGQANAGTLSSRRVTISTSQPDVTGVTYSFAFTTTVLADIQSMIFQFCDTPLGTCVLPGTDGTPTAAEKLDASHATASPGAFTGTTATAFAEHTGADTGACTESDGGSGVATMYCVSRTETTDEAAGAKTFVVNNISNPIIPTNNNEEVYVRISTYSDAAWATNVDSGTVAASIVNQLTVTGRVQERLVFCVFALDDAAASSSTVSDQDNNVADAGEFPGACNGYEANRSSNVDIGVVDNLAIARAPVDNAPPASLGNDRIGAAMVNTNASGGVSLTYYATAETGITNEPRAFRVPGQDTCDVSGTSLTDQCFISAANASETFVVDGVDQERFGMNIVCITNSDTIAAGTTKNLGAGGNGAGTGNTFNTAYANGDTTQDNIEDTASDNCENNVGETNVYAWNDTSTADALISSSTVVDDEMVKLRFAALAQATTPTGTYSVASTFIATPTF